ncbi:MAG TPA: EAL domain-containing protein [Acidimicrobiales bacterium]|nr:EAL domain-containing protein [Acidimicrobiales bacterium]
MSWSDDNAPSTGGAGFGARFRARLADRANLAVPPVIGLFCLIRSWGLIADIPYWVIAALLLFALAVNSVNSALWADGTRNWRLHVRVGVEMAVIAVVIYGIGWGAILAIGFVFGAVDVMRSAGSAAARPAIVWTLVCIAAGQLAIAAGLAPTLIHEPLVDSLSALDALGAVVTILVLQWLSMARETSEGRFEALVHEASDIIVVSDDLGRLTYVSPAFDRILGTSGSSFHTRSAAEMMHPDDLANLMARPRDIRHSGGDGLHVELRLRHADGTWRWFEAKVTNHLGNPKVRGIVGNLHDITDRKHTEEALREAHERFRSAFENAPIGMVMADLEGTITSANPALGRILGRDAADLGGMNLMDLTHPDDRELSRSEMECLVASDSDQYRIEERCCHSDGHDVWVAINVSCVRDDEDQPLYLIGQIEDITEGRALRERLAFAAIHDSLTLLPNRELFMDRLEVALRRAVRGHHRVAVIFLDLDRFKLVNDSLGHEVGDRVLRAVADRLNSVMRGSDTLARFGGDEFTVLCDEVGDDGDALEVAQRLVAAMDQPLALPTGEVFASLSVGIALSGNGSESGAVLLRNADVAMYRAKGRGPSRIEIYREDDEQNVLSRLRTSSELHRALERDELVLHYQPLVDLHTETLVGMEALVRWQHPTRGLLAPYEFIPLAEDSGLIVSLGAWVLNEACRQVALWSALRAKAGQDEARLNISVNVSALQLADPGFPHQVVTALETSRINPDRLWLEITESTLMHDADEAVLVLHALRELGLHFEIDDFGTGYSSLTYLKRFPVETLKVDRSFVEELDQRSENAAIVRAIIGLGDSLGLSIVAEGVERRGQVEKLQSLGCHLAQGYLFGEPLPASSLGAFPTDDLGSWHKLVRSAAS